MASALFPFLYLPICAFFHFHFPHLFSHPQTPRRLLSDDMKESGMLPVLARCARAFNPKLQPRAHAVDVIMVRDLCVLICPFLNVSGRF